jgi:microsomal dipeptidase-like Zn-dependent dipeptidase
MRRGNTLGLSACSVLIGLGLVMISSAHAQQPQPQPTPEVLDGYADIHVHQMAHLGFAGSIVWGAAGGDPATALGPVPPSMRRGHDGVEGATHGRFVPVLFRTLINALLGDWFRHNEEGFPSFNSWPSVNRWTHQQVYKEWLFRAYQGGLRLMVMLAANSEDMFGRGEDEIPLLRHHVVQQVKAPGRSSNDMESLDWQIRAAYRLQTEIDNDNGGPGKGWYRIVRDPEEASKVISEGKLAVILGTELQHLFNCDSDRPACSRDTVIEGLNRLEAMGVNYVFPVHHKLNQFAGPAKFSFANNGPSEKCPDYQPRYEHDCSAVGLTDLGRFLVEELSARGMLIDTEHMSIKTFNDAMDIAEHRRYPVLAGHVIPFDLAVKEDRTERAKNKSQLQRIFGVGGIVAPMLGTRAGVYLQGGVTRIPIYCKPTDGGSVDQWANAYLFVKDVASENTTGNAGSQLALGSDWNGFAGWPGPRDKCAAATEPRVTYPYLLPEGLTPAVPPVSTMDMLEFPVGKKWDFNHVGAAHVGMLPDFLRDVQLLGVTEDELKPIYRSARAVVDLWTRARNRNEFWSRLHLRWIPQHPFDTFDFPDASDRTRVVEGLKDFPICRSRLEHKLGFVKGDSCEWVESPPEEKRDPVEVAAYHDGRCLTGSSWKPTPAVQRVCQNMASQRWYFRLAAGKYRRIQNSLTGWCLTSSHPTGGLEGKVIETPCSPGNPNQEWHPERWGNTFRLIGYFGRCLGVKDQSRADGAEIREQSCTGASNQLWSVEALRQSDYETLYQADKNRYEWLSSATESYPYEVEVDAGRQICRAASEFWLGIVHGQQCVGKTYTGQTTETLLYEGLYQAP